MTPLAAILIAASAALHATWHTFTKKSGASLAEGVFILHERCPAPKIAGTVFILAGLALLVL